MNGLIIERVLPGSIAAELELVPGDRLVAISGHPIRDIIDYNFHAADEELTLEVEKVDGELWEVELEKDAEEPLGLIFPPPEPLRCGNRCVFCFVHQLPRGLRAPLYVKDEDYRLSFLYGNYVTLANIGEEDLTRIKEQRLSPLYVSVHATAPRVREQLLGTKGLRPILEVMEELAAARICMHTQVVLCPGINDGAVLDQTVADLADLHPWVASVAVVPVGLTGHRSGLSPLQPVTEAYAAAFIARWQPEAQSLADRFGEPFLFLADEFYIKAGIPFPPLDSYGDLPQVENGVGMVPLFIAEAREVLEEAVALSPVPVTVVTGESPYHYLADFLRDLAAKTGIDFRTVSVPNRLFGGEVTVTGLVAGRDILAALKGCEQPGTLLLPDVMLKEGEGCFLDDLTVADIAAELQTPVVVVPSTPRGIYEAVTTLHLTAGSP
jgi:putative radical SAM enzyme (TIGR03279 family)